MSLFLTGRPDLRKFLFAHFLSAVGRGLTLPFLLIYLTEVRGLSAAQAGLVVGWYGAMVLVLSPLAGMLIDRFGPRPVVITFLFFEAAGTAGLALVQSFPAALLTVSVIAVGSAAIWGGQATLLSTLTVETERQRVFGLEFTLLNLGIGVGGLIAGAIVDTARPATFQIIYLLDGLSFLMPALILLSMPGVGSRPPRAASTGPRGSRAGGYAAVLRDRAFRRLTVFAAVLTACGYAQLEVGFTAFSVQVVEVSPRIVAWALAANALTIVALQLLMIRRLEGRSRAGALATVGAVFALAWLALGLGGLSSDRTLGIVGVIGCATTFAFGEMMLSPMLPALTNVLATDELRGRYNSLIAMTTGLSGVVGPITAGPLIGAGNGAVWVALVVGGCVVASALALTLRRLLTAQQDGRAADPAQTPAGS